MKVYIMRHGEIFAADEPKRFLGITDIPMNEEGKDMVRKAAESLAEKAEKRRRMLVASPLKRCLQTACILQDHLLFDSVYVDAGLREIDLGEWEMKEIRKVIEAYPYEYRQRGERIADHRTPGGETFREAGQRFAGVFRKWVGIAEEEKVEELFIVSHRGAVLAGIGELNRETCEKMLKMKFRHADIIVTDDQGRII